MRDSQRYVNAKSAPRETRKAPGRSLCYPVVPVVILWCDAVRYFFFESITIPLTMERLFVALSFPRVGRIPSAPVNRLEPLEPMPVLSIADFSPSPEPLQPGHLSVADVAEVHALFFKLFRVSPSRIDTSSSPAATPSEAWE